MKKKKILITSVHLGIGGIETCLINFLNNIDKEKYEVDLYLLKKEKENLKKVPSFVNVYMPSYNIHSKLINKIVEKDNMMSKITRRLIYNQLFIKKMLPKKKYDVGIAFSGYQHFMDKLVAFSNCKKRYIFVHTNVKYSADHNKKYKKDFLSNSKKYTYFDKIITVSQSSLNEFEKILPQYQDKMKYIWNFFPTIISKEKIKLSDNYNIVMVGRLTEAKGYDRLIPIIDKVVKKGFHPQVYIIGSGEKQTMIMDLIKQYHLEDTITLLGSKDNITANAYLCSGDLCLLTSYYEGLCTVLIEALNNHLPFVAPKVSGIIDVASEIAPTDSFILTENNDEAIAEGIIAAMDGKLNHNFTFDAQPFNLKIKKEYQKVLEGNI